MEINPKKKKVGPKIIGLIKVKRSKLSLPNGVPTLSHTDHFLLIICKAHPSVIIIIE